MWKKLSYKGTCHVILLAKLHDMYLYKTTTFPHQPLRSVSKVSVLHRFFCITNGLNGLHYDEERGGVSRLTQHGVNH